MYTTTKIWQFQFNPPESFENQESQYRDVYLCSGTGYAGHSRNVRGIDWSGGERAKRLPAALAGSQANVTREFASYPELDDVPQLLETGFDVIIVDLDLRPGTRSPICVEHICGNSSVTVMVYSKQADPELLVRCMRAGAREFLNQPIAPSTIAEALVRASVRRPTVRAPRRRLEDY